MKMFFFSFGCDLRLFTTNYFFKFIVTPLKRREKIYIRECKGKSTLFYCVSMINDEFFGLIPELFYLNQVAVQDPMQIVIIAFSKIRKLFIIQNTC